MPVLQKVQNRYGTLHGGCVATLVDTVGSAALVTKVENAGVSLHISVDYLSSWVHICAGGGECLIEATVLRLGRTIAVVQVTLRNKQTGTLTAHGTHTKFL
eukprot:jgi/Astpho2/4867/gw1.00069.118.1_t